MVENLKIIENLQQITEWLDKNANRILQHSLQKGADKSLMSKLERTIERELPSDFVQLYEWHNGLDDSENLGNLFYGMDIFSVDKIIDEYNFDNEQFSIQNESSLLKLDPEINKSNLYNPNWLRFASDAAHTWLCLDFSPTSKGTVGQVIFIDDEQRVGLFVANSISELIQHFADDLKQGHYKLNPYALEEGNYFLDVSPDINLVNWYLSERWKRD